MSAFVCISSVDICFIRAGPCTVHMPCITRVTRTISTLSCVVIRPADSRLSFALIGVRVLCIRARIAPAAHLLATPGNHRSIRTVATTTMYPAAAAIGPWRRQHSLSHGDDTQYISILGMVFYSAEVFRIVYQIGLKCIFLCQTTVLNTSSRRPPIPIPFPFELRVTRPNARQMPINK